MAKLVWGEVTERFYEIGVDRGVLYTSGSPGVAWNGLISVEENPANTDVKAYYLDGIKYLQVPSYEEFEATITAYNRPKEFAKCEGISTGINGMLVTQQKRQQFGLTYRTLVGNDTEGLEYGYKLHIVYNALAVPSQRSYNSLSSTVNPAPYSWQISACPIIVPGYKQTSHLIIDSATAPAEILAELEDILYGSDAASPRLPLPEEIFELGFGIQVTDNGDGTFTVVASDDFLTMLDDTTFEITSPSAIFINPDSYTISSM